MDIKGKLKSRELAERIRELIARGGLEANDPILSENQLAAKFNISRVTVRQGIADLVEEGILFKVKGKGTFVADGGSTSDVRRSDGGFSKTVALLMPCISNSYNANIARGIEDAARKKGYHVMFRSTDGVVSEEKSGVDELLAAKIAGIILSPSESNPLPPYLQRIAREFDNLVIINEVVLGMDVDVVTSDDVEGAYIATKHLLELGHTRIAHLRGPGNVMNALSREEGYQKALNESGIDIDKSLIVGCSTYSMNDAYAATMLLLKKSNERPSAVFAANDNMACGAIQAAEESGLSVPADLAVVGYGDLTELSSSGYAITSVKQNAYEIGRRSCEALLGVLSGSETSFKRHRNKILVSPELVVRNSCGGLDSKKNGAGGAVSIFQAGFGRVAAAL